MLFHKVGAISPEKPLLVAFYFVLSSIVWGGKHRKPSAAQSRNQCSAKAVVTDDHIFDTQFNPEARIGKLIMNNGQTFDIMFHTLSPERDQVTQLYGIGDPREDVDLRQINQVFSHLH